VKSTIISSGRKCALQQFFSRSTCTMDGYGAGEEAVEKYGDVDWPFDKDVDSEM
jgi:hypothetical protein